MTSGGGNFSKIGNAKLVREGSKEVESVFYSNAQGRLLSSLLPRTLRLPTPSVTTPSLGTEQLDSSHLASSLVLFSVLVFRASLCGAYYFVKLRSLF